MKTIRLQNFRCFTDFSLHLKSGINLLVGDNASGKTSILQGCKYIMSAFFSGFSDENTKWESPDKADFKVASSDNYELPDNDVKLSFTCTDGQFPEISGFERLYDETYIIKKSSRKNTRAQISGLQLFRNYTSALHDIYSVYDQNTGQTPTYKELPLFAAFSTSDIHSKRKIADKKFIQYSPKRTFGYYECLNGSGLYKYWRKRLLILQEANRNTHEIETVRTAIIKALGQDGCGIISDMYVRPMQKQVYFRYIDGREVPSGLLSDGYMRLVNIVTDLAFRCAILNTAIYPDDVLSRTKGSVIIDEIDMHLHPSLQAKVLKGLRNAFPNIQFIVSTHAPMVMTGVENNSDNIVYKLYFNTEMEDYGNTPISPYGLDMSTITENLLGQTPRDQEVEEKLNELFSLIDNDKLEDAKRVLNSLRDKFGENLPELTRAENMLDFAQMDLDA